LALDEGEAVVRDPAGCSRDWVRWRRVWLEDPGDVV
jgi:hypothetical protein